MEHLSYGAVRSYLAAFWHLHISNGFPGPYSVPVPRLCYVLTGMCCIGAAKPRAKRLPITPQILQQIHKYWSQSSPGTDRILLWAAFALGFFGFLRAGEFTHTSESMATDMPISVNDVSVDSHDNLSHLQVRLRTSRIHLGLGSPYT